MYCLCACDVVCWVVIGRGDDGGEPVADGLSNLTGGLVLVTGAGWALGRDQLNNFAVVKEFKTVCHRVNLIVILVCCDSNAVPLLTAAGQASVLWLRAHRRTDV